ncbi:hypothetical protein ND861_16290 [Leptospira sp. 2 VSF19]|uniref:Uncharacterized protein n=1 Tax=Leptospira soteropolitanensis TaxID=2950025 RepID=A0AAW5VG16_9LEPT|nr:hypothetical protein [Leptospira soteropolitanensis]MCW7494206.1 hypothetical protein [Leptospira soteropolitanensis]MCW7501819.1 hypothetical protein [Leptospira soteropolitanensis]MCW7524052.1 hypothetical protein [Leptospira soteropolitanensis]MCW7527917.1 hypothetical protein [Leptospira soteropolitanensis]MCW7531789.1 hypothetical protein [Leptospira soteropolitanensis]
MNWKFRIRKPQTGTTLNWEVYFSPGTASWVGEKIKEILNSVPLPNQPEPNIRIFSEKIKLENTNSHQIAYLLFHGLFLRDVRLVIGRTKDWDKSSEVREEEWDRILTEAVTIAKPLFSDHNIRFYEIKENLHISYFEDEITVSLSVLGEPGYKRGIKANFPTSAPVPEDLSQILIQQCFDIFLVSKNEISALYVPFAGTLTFATEWKLQEENISLLSLPRDFLFSKLSLFPDKSVEHFKRKQKDLIALSPPNSTPIVIQDTDPALEKYWSEEFQRWQKVIQVSNWDHSISDFFKTFPVFPEGESVSAFYFLPLNPPYGLRKHERTGPEEKLYSKIGKRLEELLRLTKNHPKLIGFVLCPTEEKWSDCMRELRSFSKKTIHVTHGGIDLRVLYFHSEGRNERRSN